MREHIVNLFLFIAGHHRVIREIGATWHESDGTDNDKTAFLQSKVLEDFKVTKRHKLPKSCLCIFGNGQKETRAITYDGFLQTASIGKHMEVLENTVFRHYGFCPRAPIMVITPVVDGVVTIEGLADIQGKQIL